MAASVRWQSTECCRKASGPHKLEQRGKAESCLGAVRGFPEEGKWEGSARQWARRVHVAAGPAFAKAQPAGHLDFSTRRFRKEGKSRAGQGRGYHQHWGQEWLWGTSGVETVVGVVTEGGLEHDGVVAMCQGAFWSYEEVKSQTVEGQGSSSWAWCPETLHLAWLGDLLCAIVCCSPNHLRPHPQRSLPLHLLFPQLRMLFSHHSFLCTLFILQCPS